MTDAQVQLIVAAIYSLVKAIGFTNILLACFLVFKKMG
jgi:hypothetical protein